MSNEITREQQAVADEAARAFARSLRAKAEEVERRLALPPERRELSSRRPPGDVMLVGVSGHVRLDLYGPDGALKDVREKHNLVVNSGLDWIREFGFDSVNPTALARMSHIAVGDDATPETNADTALLSELFRQAFTAVTGYAAGGTGVCTLVTTLAAGDGTGAITEVGVFNDAAAGEMWNRATFPAVNKGAGDVLKVTVTITFTAVT